MELNQILENERKWKHFLSSIKTFRYLPTNNVTIKTKHNLKNLSTKFANKLLQKKGGTIELAGKADVLDKYKHLDVRYSERNSPYSSSDHQPNLQKAETWPKSKNKILEVDDSERESVSRVLPFDTEAPSVELSSEDEDSESLLKTYDDKRKTGVDVSFMPRKRARTDSYMDDTSEERNQNDIILKGTNISEETRNEQKSDCFDGKPVLNSATKQDETSDTYFKNIVPKSLGDEIDCGLPSSFPSIIGGNKPVSKTAFKNDDSDMETVASDVDLSDVKWNATAGENSDQISVDQLDKKLNEVLNTNLMTNSVPFTNTKDEFKTNRNVKNEGSVITDRIKKETSTCIQVAAENFIHVNDTININRSRERHKYTPPKKSDIDKACSSWKVQDIAEYFIFDECVTKLDVPDKTSSFLDEVYDFVLNDVMRRLEIVKGADLTLRKRNKDSELLTLLKSITSTETGSRLILDALLIPLCSVLGIQIEVDKNIDCSFLPNCRFDYCLKKGQRIIGCVEAKSIKSLSDSSVAQALLQLMILQTALTTDDTDSNFTDTPVFCIVTDGHRFIYIQLKGEYLGFEHDFEKIKIREVRTEHDFKQIMQHICFLIGDQDSQNSEVIIID